MFTCIFSLARTVGWIAQWQEMITDPEYKIGRPRQLYKGADAARGEADRQEVSRHAESSSSTTRTCSAATRRSSRSCTRSYLVNPPVGAGGVARLLRPDAGAARRDATKDVAHAPVVEIVRATREARRVRRARAPCRPSSSRPSASRSRRCSWSPRTASPARAGRRRSAQAHAAAEHPGARAGVLRPDRSRHGPGVQHRLVHRPGTGFR